MISLEQLKQQFLHLQREFYRDRQSRPLSTPWTAQQFRWFKTKELVGATTTDMAESDWVERGDDTSKGTLEVYQQNGSLQGEPVGTKGVAAYIDGEWVHVAAEGGGALKIKTPVAGIPACTGSGTAGDPYVWGSATCDLIDPDTGAPYSPNRTQTIYNSVNQSIGGSVAGKAEKVGTKYFIDVASCP